jgi:hypothetical protein
MGFTGAVVLGFAFWQLRSVNRALRESDAAKRQGSGSDAEPTQE